MRGCCAYLWRGGFVGFIQIETWGNGDVRVFGGGAALVGNLRNRIDNRVVVCRVEDRNSANLNILQMNIFQTN